MNKRRSFFWQLLILILCACLLTVVLTGVLYSLTGAQMFAARIAQEMYPRAESIARLATRFQTGQLSFDSFADFATKEQRSDRIFIFDDQGNVVARNVESGSDVILRQISLYASQVLATGMAFISTDWRSIPGIVVGAPIFDNMQRVTGAVFISKPRNEVRSAMSGLTLAMILAGAAAACLMVVPAYIASSKISGPLRKMTRIASQMAAGDFSARAEDTRTDEVGQLGIALNYLAGALDANIRELVLAHNRLRSILEGLGEGIVSLDRELNPTYHNPAAERYLLSALDSKQKLPEALINAASQVLSDGLTHTQSLRIGEAELLATASPAQASASSQANVIVLIQDVTETERLEQTRRDYVANVSHELRTPIASIRSLAEALNDGLIRTDEDKSRYYGYILRESMRLSRLINDLLELSRLQSGTIALEKAPFDLSEVVESIAQRVSPAAGDSGITLSVCLPDSLPQAYSNRDRIEQVLVALVDNAIKYADDDGSVTISAQDDGDRLMVSVRNTGGINPKDLPHLFDRFYKADASHSAGGTGLGLAIARELMTRLGETIQAANEDGEAVFRITLEKADPDREAKPALLPKGE